MQGKSTYRERRERKAERLREWADSRDAKADASYEGVKAITDRIPFGQPILVGHHSERGARADQRRIERGMDSFSEHNAKAREMRERADNIEKAARRAIYSDDPDAVERLTEKLAGLERRRDAMKAANAKYRVEHKAELKAMTPYQRSQAVPAPNWALTNLGATIRATQKRLAEVQRQAERSPGDRGPGRQMAAKYIGECAECGNTVQRGDPMTYYRATREVVCEACASTRGDSSHA